jgi:hypothetical protein
MCGRLRVVKDLKHVAAAQENVHPLRHHQGIFQVIYLF